MKFLLLLLVALAHTEVGGFDVFGSEKRDCLNAVGKARENFIMGRIEENPKCPLVYYETLKQLKSGKSPDMPETIDIFEMSSIPKLMSGSGVPDINRHWVCLNLVHHAYKMKVIFNWIFFK